MDRTLKVMGSDGVVLFERGLATDERIEIVEGAGNGPMQGGYCEIWIRGTATEEPDLVVAAPIQEESAERVP